MNNFFNLFSNTKETEETEETEESFTEFSIINSDGEIQELDTRDIDVYYEIEYSLEGQPSEKIVVENKEKENKCVYFLNIILSICNFLQKEKID